MRAEASVLPLRLEAVGLAVGGARLLAGIDLVVRPGRRLVVLGPNGAGKTLLIRICHGLIAPTEGRVGWALPERAAAAQAMVFQRPVLLRRSAAANIDHALALAGLPRTLRRRRRDAALERFGLTELADRPARLLSGGEQQRLALARAWARRPQVMFLDEPCSQTDPGATRTIEAAIRGLADEGITVVMTTHDLGQARRLAEEAAFLHRGRLVESGPAEGFFARPRSAEARAFLAGELPW
jgi:tungstate transport system ATP-binding protein